MRSLIFILLALIPIGALADTQSTVDDCIGAWKNSPFKKGYEADKVIGGQVKVLGIGKKDFEDNDKTEKPDLVLIKPSVNVLGTTAFRLMNPNGWYCFKSNVSVLGKIDIMISCKAHMASAGDGGASVLGADESEGGVTVLGTLRVTRVGCDKSEKASQK